MSDERIMTQAEAEAGTSTEKLATTAERQKQAIMALAGIGGFSAIITESTTSRTLVPADGDNKYIRCTNVALTTITIPTNASVAFALDTEITFVATQDKVDFSHAGVTLNEPQGLSDYIVVTIKKVATDEWDAVGAT